jgi:hypothetical protein
MTWRELQIKKYNTLASLAFVFGLVTLIVVSFLVSMRINADVIPYNEAIKLRMLYTSLATMPFFIITLIFECIAEKYKTKL